MKIRPLTRKETLIDRAARVSARLRERGHPWDNAHDGFVAGYKAAMRDMCKVVRDANKDAITMWQALEPENPFTRVKRRNNFIRIAVQRFLRPLR